MLRSVVASLVAAIVITASAAEPASQADARYSVELIVFRPTTPLGVTEDWQSEARATGNPAVGASESGESGTEAPAPARAGTLSVSPMSPALFKLTGIES